MYRFHGQTDRHTVIDTVKMKCAGIAQSVFLQYYGPLAQIPTSQQRKEKFLLSLSLVIGSGVSHPPHQSGIGAVSPGVNWAKLEVNPSASLPSLRKYGVEITLRRMIL